MNYLLTLFALFVFSTLAATTTKEEPKKIESPAYKDINTDELKSMIDTKVPMIILDARKKLKGGLLPGAKNLPYDTEEKDITNSLGSISKDTTIVVYCANMYCPLSKYLAEKLAAMGYTKIFKYPDGVAGWLDKDYPLDPIHES